jgi:hypothetical protein
MFKSNLIGKMEKSCLKNFKLNNSHIRILNICIGSEAESSELLPTKNRIKNDRLDDEKPSKESSINYVSKMGGGGGRTKSYITLRHSIYKIQLLTIIKGI